MRRNSHAMYFAGFGRRNNKKPDSAMHGTKNIAANRQMAVMGERLLLAV